MAKKNDKVEVPKNIPIIKVRQQFTTKCGVTCAGRGHEREKRWPPCGPSPPASIRSDVTCGIPDCFDEETCRCRCPCGLKELMRRQTAEPPSQVTPEQSLLSQNVPQLHVARIHTLEPKIQHAEIQAFPIAQAPNGELIYGFKINGHATGVPTQDQAASQPEQHAVAADTGSLEQTRNGGVVTTRRPDPLDSGPKKKTAVERPEDVKQTPAGGNDAKREGGAAKKYRVPKAGYQRWLPHWWYIYGGAPPEPCRGGQCFFGSPARTFNTTAEVLGELPEWNLEPIKRVCRSCIDGAKKMYCPRRKSSLTGRKPELKKGVERICR